MQSKSKEIKAVVVIKYLLTGLVAGLFLWVTAPFILLYMFVLWYGPATGGGW